MMCNRRWGNSIHQGKPKCPTYTREGDKLDQDLAANRYVNTKDKPSNDFNLGALR